MTQPSGPSARDIAEAIIDDIWPNWSTCQHLAKEYLAIESRCKRLEAIAEAARRECFVNAAGHGYRRLHVSDDLYIALKALDSEQP